MEHDVQLPRWPDETWETLELCFYDQGMLGVVEVVDLCRDGCKQEAGEVEWRCGDPGGWLAGVLELL